MSDPRQQQPPPPPPSSSSQQQQHQQQQQSSYAYPSPATHLPTRTDLSLREIIDTYRDNQELLKQVLTAKSEEDKRRAEEEKYKTEQLRLQCKQVELEMLREQKKPPTILTGMPPINTGYSVKSPSDIHSPSYPSIPPPIGTVDTHYSTTTPTSATRLSPPSSASHADTTSFSGLTNPSSSNYQIGQRPTLTLAIPSPSFPLVTSSPTNTHAPHSFTTTPTTMHDSPHHHAPHRHHNHVYTQSPTSATSAGPSAGHKRKPEPEVDHQYVMEAIRQKVRQNAENPAKKQAGAIKTRSSSTPVVSITSPAGTTSTTQSSSSQSHTRPHSSHPSTHAHSPCTHNSQHVHSPHTAQPHQSPHAAHPQHPSPHHASSPVHPQPQQPSSSNGSSLTHSPLPPMTVHSPVLNQEGVAKS